MANLKEIVREIKLSKKKYKQFNNSRNKSILDQVLWFIEYYLPKNKDRGIKKKLHIVKKK